MSKRPSIDLMALTSEQAAPMPEAAQRMPVSTPIKTSPKTSIRPAPVKTENLEALAFKVPPVFRKRFKQRAVTADLKLNELLFEALEAWEKMNGIKN
jgi:hypothetical protein